MRMFCACVNIELSIHLRTQFVFRQHTANRHFHYAFRTLFEHMTGLSERRSAGISGMMEICLLD